MPMPPTTEDELEVGRGGRGGRRPGRAGLVALAAVLALGLGWVAWHGGLDDPPRPRRTAPSPAPEEHARPAAVPYLRSGTLVEPGGALRGVPDGSWSDLEQLPDGTVVLAGAGQVVLIGPAGRRVYPTVSWAGTLVHRADRSAVAWRRADGVVMTTGPAGPTATRARIVRPECRGLRSHGELQEAWRRCDDDGHLLSADRSLVALVGARSVSLAPPDDITAATSWKTAGSVVDATWEDDDHLLVVVADGDRTLLQRVGRDTAPETLLATTAYDPRRPVLVLP